MPTAFSQPAHRAYEDAMLLHVQGRLGTSDHLYGIAGECALKAILVGLNVIVQTPPNRPEPPYAQHVPELWDEYVAAMEGRMACGYIPSTSNPFLGWRIEHRYSDDVDFDNARVDNHRDAAAVVMELLERAELDGVVR